jgi:hypothetical protein
MNAGSATNTYRSPRPSEVPRRKRKQRPSAIPIPSRDTPGIGTLIVALVALVIACAAPSLLHSNQGCANGWSYEPTGLSSWCNGPHGQTCVLRGSAFGNVRPTDSVWCKNGRTP